MSAYKVEKMQVKRLLHTFVLLLSLDHGATAGESKWASVPEFMDTSLAGTLAWQKILRSSIDCIRICLQDHQCVSAFYNTISGTCSSVPFVYSAVPDAAVTEVGSRYYKVVASASTSQATTTPTTQTTTSTTTSTSTAATFPLPPPTTTIPTTTVPSCPTGYSYEPNASSCIKLVMFETPYMIAATTCSLDGGQLLSVTTNDIHDFVKSYVPVNASYWVGGTDSSTEGTWLWADGTEVTMETPPWKPNQPDNSLSNQHCLLLDKSFNFSFDDTDCSESFGYICQVFLTASASTSTGSWCPSGYTLDSKYNFCYRWSNVGNTSYAAASSACHSDGGHLGDIKLSAVRDYLATQLPAFKYWTGGTDKAVEGVWRWTDQSFIYMSQPPWMSGQPDNAVQTPDIDQDCLILNGYHQFEFDDSFCFENFGYICQIDQP